MTYTKEMSGPFNPSLSDRTRQLHLSQIFEGPAHKCLSYSFSYAYTQKIDVLSYLAKHDLKLHFFDSELKLLSRVRNAKLYTIPVLYKIFRFCCEDKLQDLYSQEWNVAPILGTSNNSLESHIAVLHQLYVNFVANGTGDVENLVNVILGIVQKVGEVLGVNKWKQQQEVIKKNINDILEDVHPGMDINERVLNAVKIEAQSRSYCIKDAVALINAENKKCSSLEAEDWDEVQDLEYVITSVPDDSDKKDKDFYWNDENEVLPEEILSNLHQQCRESIDGKKICCISGAHGTGKSTLAAMFPLLHMLEENKMKHLNEYEFVLIVSGHELEKTNISKWVGSSKSQRNDLCNYIDEFWCVVEAFLPRCSAKYGVKNVGQLLTTRRILFIVDDADEMSESKIKELILFLGQIPFDSSALIFANTEAISKIKFNFISFSSVQHIHLHGLSKSFLLEKSLKFKETVKIGKKKLVKSFKDSYKCNMNRIGSLLDYPVLFQEIFSLWRNSAALVRDSYTATELIWNLVMYKSGLALDVDLKKDIKKRKKLFLWFKLVGDMCLYCLKANIKLNQASFNEIQEEAIKLFSRQEGENLSSAFFRKRLVFDCDTFQSIPSSTCNSQLEFFSSYYIVHKLAGTQEEFITSYLPKKNPEVLIGFIAGHLKRWDGADVGDELSIELSLELMQKVIEACVNYAENKNEDTEFLFTIATEFRSSHKLVQLMVNITDYPEEWDLNFCNLQQKTLEMMMQHVAPVRIILRTDKSDNNYEQIPLLKFLGRVPISVWFESRNQFRYNSNLRMDKLLKPMLSDAVVSRVDLLSGSLSRITMMDMLDYKCMTYLVMLALRVDDEDSLSTALSVPNHLRHLLWFELKIDMNIENVVLTSLPSMQVEMFDVYFRDLDDLCVPQITGILTKMHKRYSGVHLQNTTLSPESVYTLLKELKNRGIVLCASDKSIDKYRRWYYPLLSGLPTKKLLTNKEVKKILGFDDRKFYSDHKIQSSTFVKSIDAWNLTSYLEELKEIKYFEYNADNLSFVKTLKGEVETNHHSSSSVKVDTTGGIL